MELKILKKEKQIQSNEMDWLSMETDSKFDLSDQFVLFGPFKAVWSMKLFD